MAICFGGSVTALRLRHAGVWRPVRRGSARWNLIDFIRANSMRPASHFGCAGTTAAFPTPNFFRPVLRTARPCRSISFARKSCTSWWSAPARRLAACGLRARRRRQAEDDGHCNFRPEAAKNISLCVANEPETIKTACALPRRGACRATEFLVDRAGNQVRSMWRTDDIASATNSLEKRVQGLRVAPRVQRPSGTQGHTRIPTSHGTLCGKLSAAVRKRHSATSTSRPCDAIERFGPPAVTRELRWSWNGKEIVLGLDDAGRGPLVLLLPALSSISTRSGELHPLLERLKSRIQGRCR